MIAPLQEVPSDASGPAPDRCQERTLALSLMARDGIIVYDDAEGYGFHQAFLDSDLNRVDFYGHAPGVALPHATSIYFGPDAFAFRPEHRIATIALEH